MQVCLFPLRPQGLMTTSASTGTLARRSIAYVDPSVELEGNGSRNKPLRSFKTVFSLSRKLADPYTIYGNHLSSQRHSHAPQNLETRSWWFVSFYNGLSKQHSYLDIRWCQNSRRYRVEMGLRSHNLKIRVANLTQLLAQHPTLPHVASLFAPHKRLVWARYPNGDPEVA